MSVLVVADNLTPNPFPSGKGNQKKINPFPELEVEPAKIKPPAFPQRGERAFVLFPFAPGKGLLYLVPLPLGEGVRA
jgi:hypothetical protein